MKLNQLDQLARHYPDLKIISRNCRIGGVHDEYTVLQGSIPATFKKVTYNFATKIWLPYAFPQDPPRVRAAPTEQMRVRPSEYVSETGKITPPYLQSWTISSTLVELCDDLSALFSHCPPLEMEHSSTKSPSVRKLDYVPPSSARSREEFLEYVSQNVDLVKFELECAICKLFYNRKKRKRTVISTCGHQICHECAQKLPKKICPFCSQEFRQQHLVVTF